MLDAKLSRRLEAMEKVSKEGKKVQDLFKIMRNHDSLWLKAYTNIYANKGAITPGVNRNTLDGFSDERVTNIIQLLEEDRYHFHPSKRVYIPKANGKLRPLGMPMGHAYCISLQRRLGIAVVAPTSMNAIDQLTQYNELGVAGQVSSGKNRSESVRITSNRSGLLTSTPTACFSVNDGLVGQTLMAVQSCHARRRYSWPFTS